MERSNTGGGDGLPWQGTEDQLIQEAIARIQELQISDVTSPCDYCRRNPFSPCPQRFHGLRNLDHNNSGDSRNPGIQARNNLTGIIPLETKQLLYELAIHNNHPSRNYLLREYIRALSQQQLLEIVLFMRPRLIEMSLHENGCGFVLELLNNAANLYVQSLIVEVLLSGIVILMQNSRGARIISQCMRRFHDDINKLLYHEIGRHICIIAKDQVGYIQVIRLIENSPGKYIHYILMQISENALILAGDQYGNYVVQKVMDLNISCLTTSILNRLKGYYSLLSFNRYGSHVVEKCLDIQKPEQVQEIVIELLRSPNISTLLSNSYGNFVIQHAWKVSKNWRSIHEGLARLIQQHASELCHNLYGRNVLNKLKDCNRGRCRHALR